MPRCTRRGCGQDYVVTENTEASCIYHPGAPVFHEGLKSWSCCSELNKPVLDFDEFMNIPGCTTGSHTEEVPDTKSQTKKKPAQGNLTLRESSQGTEVYSTQLPKAPAEPTAIVGTATSTEPPPEEDDLSASVPPGTVCKRKGCGTAFVSDEENRIGDGAGTVCTHHPAPVGFNFSHIHIVAWAPWAHSYLQLQY
ncbi:hypothetical protein ID866_4213 [Astraeus odoratus]|nr:hypothetical protein ID866_4213 [Astraeus odoratus]